MQNIDPNALIIFNRNTDAISTNRGFYYQYLNILKKWLHNFVNNIESSIYTEVENDIKEVGNHYAFTQLKCYTSDFSLNSKEIKTSIFDFFMTYLQYRADGITPVFSFVTNSGIKKNEKLLGKWLNREIFKIREDTEVLKKKVREILKSESNKIRQSKLNRINLSTEKKNEVNASFHAFCSIINDNLLLENFCTAVQWEFGLETTEEAIYNLRIEIFDLLRHQMFAGRSEEIIFRVLLSEINRRSQETKSEMRCVTTTDLQSLLNFTDVEIQERIDLKFIHLIGVEVEQLKHRIKNLENVQEKHSLLLNVLKPVDLHKTDLTLIPYLIADDDIIGWDTEIDEAITILKNKKILNIYSFGGIGKTSFTKKLLTKYRNHFNNVIWLNVEESLHTSFVLNDSLISNLNINLNKKLTIEQQFDTIINELDKHQENNLIILDIQITAEKISDLKKVASLRNWNKVFLTRNQYKTYNPYQLLPLDFVNAKKLFQAHCSQEIDDTLFKDFLEYIDSNNLIITLVAKTIENSYDLSLSFIFTSLKEQNLNNNLLKIDIELSEENNKLVHIFDFILQKFSIEALEDNEKYYLEYLSLLPSTEIIIEDLILICGRDFYEDNKIQFINWTNALERQGFIQYENGRKSIRIHKMLQDSIIYSIRHRNSSFISSFHYIAWLAGRLSDGYNSPKEAFRFLKYAESILSKIKEEYRTSIYQPLLLLENEYLHLSSFFFIRENAEKLWQNLISRSEKYLGMNNICLGAMYNNLALSQNKYESIDKIIQHLNQSVAIFNKQADFKEADLLMFITSLNNLAQAYLLKDDFDGVMKCLKKVLGLRKKYTFYNDAQIGVGYTILSELHRKNNDFNNSEFFIKEAIKYHKAIPIEKRNDILLSSYYNKLSENLLLKTDIRNAIVYQEECVQILESQGITNLHIAAMYSYLIDLYKVSSQIDKINIYELKLKALQPDKEIQKTII